ncbi:MAG: hypothetical protein R2692_03375 [Microbacterium sp.]
MIDTVFVAFVIAARWPWALLVYAVALAVFSVPRAAVVLSAIALRVSSFAGASVPRRARRAHAGGVATVAATAQSTYGLNVLVGVPFVALISSVIGASLRIALGRARTTAELQRRIETGDRAENDSSSATSSM